MIDGETRREVARMIHAIECKSNHTDQCSWLYEKWTALDAWTRSEALDKADKLLLKYNPEVVMDILRVVHGREFIWNEYEL